MAVAQHNIEKMPVAVVVMGASGDLASKKVLPAIYSIFKYGDQLCDSSIVVGYSRTPLTDEMFYSRLAKKNPDLEDLSLESTKKFKNSLFYVSGEYSGESGYTKLNEFIKSKMLQKFNATNFNKIFYLALPPEKFADAAAGLSTYLCDDTSGYNRLVIEKPFGTDTESCTELLKEINKYWNEDQVYRIDHFLGKEVVASLTSMKFGNPVIQNLCNNKNTEYVEITLYEDIGTEGRSGYFDKNGIIRDVVQNHMIQMFSLIAMDCPKSNCPVGIRDAKVKLLKCVKPIDFNEILIGQYTANKERNKKGYLDDEGVPKGSTVPTFASMILHVDNDTWKGVPFVFKCGKAMNKRLTEIKIHLLPKPNSLFSDPPKTALSIVVQPKESLNLSFVHKEPGISSNICTSNLNFNYNEVIPNTRLPDAYEALFIDVLNNNSSNFVREDELIYAWKIVTPTLQYLEENSVKPEPYPYYSNGPKSLDCFLSKHINPKQKPEKVGTSAFVNSGN